MSFCRSFGDNSFDLMLEIDLSFRLFNSFDFTNCYVLCILVISVDFRKGSLSLQSNLIKLIRSRLTNCSTFKGHF